MLKTQVDNETPRKKQLAIKTIMEEFKPETWMKEELDFKEKKVCDTIIGNLNLSIFLSGAKLPKKKAKNSKLKICPLRLGE